MSNPLESAEEARMNLKKRREQYVRNGANSLLERIQQGVVSQSERGLSEAVISVGAFSQSAIFLGIADMKLLGYVVDYNEHERCIYFSWKGEGNYE